MCLHYGESALIYFRQNSKSLNGISQSIWSKWQVHQYESVMATAEFELVQKTREGYPWEVDGENIIYIRDKMIAPVCQGR